VFKYRVLSKHEGTSAQSDEYEVLCDDSLAPNVDFEGVPNEISDEVHKTDNLVSRLLSAYEDNVGSYMRIDGSDAKPPVTLNRDPAASEKKRKSELASNSVRSKKPKTNLVAIDQDLELGMKRLKRKFEI
jgi:hypothetical protein